ncbi:uncharacterized protein BDW47DRAFT_100233 [Aspergillus candidus]|uniref:Uncharacterized protein n=1 Tax=Aspergillus candidus TaxID=41067 RepID=A0A2I2FJY0_ASPCN|nr:hypothetical protein BDW47DRAFT_100233 [Aspergillus candidus]PLB40948.1 hypothetical protein BDW47DRAFT_100233 [Aspergillus candidus]
MDRYADEFVGGVSWLYRGSTKLSLIFFIFFFNLIPILIFFYWLFSFIFFFFALIFFVIPIYWLMIDDRRFALEVPFLLAFCMFACISNLLYIDNVS